MPPHDFCKKTVQNFCAQAQVYRTLQYRVRVSISVHVISPYLMILLQFTASYVLGSMHYC